MEIIKMSKVCIVSSSLRPNSNSEILATEFKKGAEKAGNEVKYFSIKDLDLKYCIGCLSCQKTCKCALKDSMNSLYDDVSNSDILVFATPIYYYGISGQLKTFLDRLNPLFNRNNKFKEVYLLCTAAENEQETYERAVSCLQGWVDCFEGVKIKETLFVGDVTAPKEILKKHDGLERAYNLGLSIK